MMVLDELHRTGAEEWEKAVDKLLENQTEEVKVLGMTATPVRDVDGRDMAEETAKKLGYTDEEIKQRKHLASNMTLENAIRLGYVVNPKIVYCKYDLISSGKMDELKAKIDDIEDEEKRAEELQKYNKLREKLNKEIDAEIGEEARKKLEEEARKNLDSGIGKEEIIRQHVKKGGKYIVFIPVTDQGDIVDENGNRIGAKTGEDKIKAYQEYLQKVFEGTDIVPQLHAMSGSWNGKGKNADGKDKNQQELDAFEADNSDKTKFMVVMDKANEGLHIAGIDGIIWFRALDENSKILYLQQLGRAIYALDEDNPLPDDKRPIVIDLANNTLTVKLEKEFENAEPIDDLVALEIVAEWINEHNGIVPDKNSSNKQEQHYYAVLRRIQNKYSKYLEGFDEFEDLEETDKERIQEIIDLATEIDLWDMDLPPITKAKGNKDEFDPFTIEGVLRDFVELEEKIDSFVTKGQLLKNALKIENWCKVNYSEKRIWERRLPIQTSKDMEEKRLGSDLSHLRTKLKQYEGKDLEEVTNEEDRRCLEIIRRLDEEYAFGHNQTHETLGIAMKIENWCKVNYGDKEKWERRLPSTMSEDEEEKRLGHALNNLKTDFKQYEGRKLEEIEDEEDRKCLEIIRRLDEEYAFGLNQLHCNLGTALKIENWCKVNYGEKEVWNRKLPTAHAKDEEEKKLGGALHRLKIQLKQYKGQKLEEVVNEEDRRCLEIIRRLEEEYAFGFQQLHYNLGLTMQIENWCKKNYEHIEISKRRLPSRRAEDSEEKFLGEALNGLRKKLKQYEGKALEEAENEEDRRVLKIIRRIDENYAFGEQQLHYNLGRVLEIENWCQLNYGNKEKWDRKLPSLKSTDKKERSLGRELGKIRTNLEKYEGKELEEVENEEDRRVLEVIRRLNEKYAFGEKQLHYNLGRVLEIENWCKINYGDKEKWDRKLPSSISTDEEEKKLGVDLAHIRQKLKKYEGKELEEVENEEDRKVLEIVRRLDDEYNWKKNKNKDLQQAQQERDNSKATNDEAREFEIQVAEELKKRGKKDEKQ